MAGARSKTVVFIPGAWMAAESWDKFRRAFIDAGFTVHSPAWPLLDRGTPPPQLRRKPPKGLGGMSIEKIVDHYAAFIATLPEKPLIVGHSFGGLFAQLLLDRGLGVAGIAIDPAPIGGVVPGPRSLGAALPVIARIAGWSRPHTLSRKAFAKNFANTATPELQKEAYDKYVVPTSGRIFHQAAFWWGTFVKPKQRAQPLLIIVGEEDRTVTPYVARAAFNKQSKSKAKTDFKSFPHLSHFLIGEPGWERVASHALDWAGKL